MRIKIKFKEPKDWDEMKKIAFAQRIVYHTKGGSDCIHAISCQREDEKKVKAFLKQANIV